MTQRGLESLMTALRRAGLAAGPTEVLRVRRLIELSGDLDREGLGRVVAAIVVKSTGDRARFQAIFDAWFTEAALELERAHTPRPLGERLVPRPGPLYSRPPWGPHRTAHPWRVRAVQVIAVAGGVAVIALGTWVYISRAQTYHPVGVLPPFEVPAVPAASTGAPAASSAEVPLPPASASSADPAPDPSRTGVVPPPPVPPVLGPSPDGLARGNLGTDYPVLTPDGGGARLLRTRVIAALAAFAVGLGIWLGLRRRRYLPDPEPPASRAGPLDVPFKVQPARRPQLLDPRERDALVWGIGRFASEEAAEALDVDRSVESTAGASGIPALHFLREGLFRTVSLWIDDSAEEPAMARFADEVESALRSVGLPVDIAHFWAIPDRLAAPDGAPIEVEGRSAESIVAILTDGRALSIRSTASEQRARIQRLLRRLSSRPRLAFVDFGGGRHGLSAIVAGHQIPVLLPEDAATFLAEGRLARAGARAAQHLEGDALAWAAACAISPRPVDEETALALRQFLRLDVSAWMIGDLTKREGAGQLSFSLAEQIELTGWLHRAERAGEGQLVHPESLLGRALSFWRQRYVEEDQERTRNQAAEPWIDTPAQRRLRIERAMLDLWDAPDAAARELYRFTGTDLEELARRRLAVVAPLECEGTRAVVVMPWRFGERPAEVRVMLRSLGFGSAAAVSQKETLRRPGRLGLAIGLCGGLGAGALAAVFAPLGPATCAAPEGAWCEVSPRPDGRFDLLGGRGGFWTSIEVGAGERAELRFEKKLIQCVEELPGVGQIARCARGDRPIATWGRRRLAVIDEAAEPALAARLLEAGTVNAAILLTAGASLDSMEALLGPASPAQAEELLFVRSWKHPDSTTDLLKRHFPGHLVVATLDGPSVKPIVFADGEPFGKVFVDGERHRALTTHDDFSGRIWTTESPAPVVLRGHKAKIERASFSPDGKLVLTVATDGETLISKVDGSGAPVSIPSDRDAFDFSYSVFAADSRAVLALRSSPRPDDRSRLDAWVAGWSTDDGLPRPLGDPRGSLPTTVDARRVSRDVTSSGVRLPRALSPDGTELLVLAPVSGLAITPLKRTFSTLVDQQGRSLAAEWSPAGDSIISVSEDVPAYRVFAVDRATGSTTLTQSLTTGLEGSYSTTFATYVDASHILTVTQTGKRQSTLQIHRLVPGKVDPIPEDGKTLDDLVLQAYPDSGVRWATLILVNFTAALAPIGRGVLVDARGPTGACLAPEARQAWLGESPEDAKLAAWACSKVSPNESSPLVSPVPGSVVATCVRETLCTEFRGNIPPLSEDACKGNGGTFSVGSTGCPTKGVVATCTVRSFSDQESTYYGVLKDVSREKERCEARKGEWKAQAAAGEPTGSAPASSAATAGPVGREAGKRGPVDKARAGHGPGDMKDGKIETPDAAAEDPEADPVF